MAINRGAQTTEKRVMKDQEGETEETDRAGLTTIMMGIEPIIMRTEEEGVVGVATTIVITIVATTTITILVINMETMLRMEILERIGTIMAIIAGITITMEVKVRITSEIIMATIRINKTTLLT